MLKRIFKGCCIGVGFLCAGIGTVGIILPILPTTPFYLLAAFCFANGSGWFHNWFTNTGLYRKHLAEYIEKREMTLKTKLSILIPATTMLLIACVMINALVFKIVIVILILTKYWYFARRIKTIPAATDTALCENKQEEDSE